MADVVELLKKNGNRLLRSEAEDIQLLKKIQESDASNVEKLRRLLTISIADVQIQTGKRHICTANEELVKAFSPIKRPTTAVKKTKQDLFKTNKPNAILAWDLLQSKYITIVGSDWKLLNFLTFKDENAKDLHDLIVDVLRQPSEK